jgi:uncharacterized protein (DUF1697 family)
MRYVALLRGINVGGQKSIKMTDLKNAFEALGFGNVKTYVQSGNVIFDAEPSDTSKLAGYIEDMVSRTYGFQVKTMIRTEDELAGIVCNNPFTKDPDLDQDKLHVTFLSDRPESNTVAALAVKKEENEQFSIIGREVYLYCPNGYGNTKLNNVLFEKKLNAIATTRNWKTVNRVLEIAGQDR